MSKLGENGGQLDIDIDIESFVFIYGSQFGTSISQKHQKIHDNMLGGWVFQIQKGTKCVNTEGIKGINLDISFVQSYEYTGITFVPTRNIPTMTQKMHQS